MRAIELIEDRKKGKSLKDLGHEYKYVTIYRAVPATVNEIKNMDYVTRSRKFAEGHANHNVIVEDHDMHVLKAMVKAEDLYEAYNPGEYFYDGPTIKGTIIYKVGALGLGEQNICEERDIVGEIASFFDNIQIDRVESAPNKMRVLRDDIVAYYPNLPEHAVYSQFRRDVSELFSVRVLTLVKDDDYFWFEIVE